MFDFGWTELLIIAVVAVFVIGPQELPAIMRAIGRVMRRVQYIRYAFSQQFEDFMREADLDQIRSQVNFEAPSDAALLNEEEADEDYLPAKEGAKKKKMAAKAKASKAKSAKAKASPAKKKVPSTKTKKVAPKSKAKAVKKGATRKPAKKRSDGGSA